MPQFIASFTKAVTGGSILSQTTLTLTDTSPYDVSDPIITKEDFYSRKFTVSDINNNVIQVLDLGAIDEEASFNISNILSLQPVYIQIRLDLIGYGGVYSTSVPYYLPTIL